MPFSEKKGRFLVTTGLEQTANSPPRPACAATTPTPSSEHRVKRGRFTVSTCLPCARPRTLHSGEGLHVSKDSASNAAPQRANSQHEMPNVSSSSDLDISPFAGSSKDQHMSGSMSGASSASSKASNSGLLKYRTRRVRFSEPGCSSATASDQAGVQSPMAASTAGPCLKDCSSSATSTPNKQQQTFLIGPMSPSPTPLTRSYCRGRFIVQEAVFVSSLPRSMSVPEHCSTLAQFLQNTSVQTLSQPSATAANLQEKQHLLDSDSEDSSGDNCTYVCAVQRQQQQQQDAVLAQAVVAAAAAAGSYWAVTSAAAIGETCGLGNTLSDDLVLFNTASSSSAAMAAAAAGQPGSQKQHQPPKRSHTVSYFRRGRFLVQTTYT